MTDNFKANFLLSPFIAYLFYLFHGYFNTKEISKIGLEESTLIFWAVYVFSSRFYNPDLDHRDFRPGKAHFPIGEIASNLIYKTPLRKLLFIQKSIADVWYILWLPPSRLVTHRGIYHWPVIGVFVRNSILLLYIYLMATFFPTTFTEYLFVKAKFIFDLFLEYKGPIFPIYILPIFVADITHSFVDLIDSILQGHSFCPPKIPRGLIASLLSKK